MRPTRDSFFLYRKTSKLARLLMKRAREAELVALHNPELTDVSIWGPIVFFVPFEPTCCAFKFDVNLSHSIVSLSSSTDIPRVETVLSDLSDTEEEEEDSDAIDLFYSGKADVRQRLRKQLHHAQQIRLPKLVRGTTPQQRVKVLRRPSSHPPPSTIVLARKQQKRRHEEEAAADEPALKKTRTRMVYGSICQSHYSSTKHWITAVNSRWSLNAIGYPIAAVPVSDDALALALPQEAYCFAEPMPKTPIKATHQVVLSNPSAPTNLETGFKEEDEEEDLVHDLSHQDLYFQEGDDDLVYSDSEPEDDDDDGNCSATFSFADNDTDFNPTPTDFSDSVTEDETHFEAPAPPPISVERKCP